MKAVLSTGKGFSTVIKTNIPIPQINENQILIKTKAFAINPTDWKSLLWNPGKKDVIVGSDVSGIVEKIGSNVKNFNKGDFISSYIVGSISTTNGAFAEYVAVDPRGSIKYNHLSDNPKDQSLKPDTIKTFIDAASITLGLVTVSSSFSYYLNLKSNSKPKDFLLIWGGATATGKIAIQLAKLIYDLTVITTASPKNHQALKELGADYIFDYNDSEVVTKIKEVTKGELKFALDTVAESETFQKLYDSTEDTKSDIYLDNLLYLTKDSINLNPNRNNNLIHWGKTSASLVIIKERKLVDKILKAPDELHGYYDEFWFNVLPEYISEIKHGNLKILNGKEQFEVVEEGLKLSEKGVSNEKIVFNL
ncbi:IFR1 [Candida jiufengensis]|uniref:IFR1 n=1 Tax=Candida jiufengensis TaxID=497108 RepID=UPI0022251B19|nr:IFR1 [Candida jiufengensis]KAI5951155.1 IFR1 [Candida jiufengensis]